ncbi:MAG: IclR family transcriptional regulator [Betaproteobacteria bacterium]|nr:IclR family transcriptional regulator [Betaproteobacteria bacterium]
MTATNRAVRQEDRVVSGARRGAVERSLHIIAILIEAAAPMSVADIANAAGLKPNSAHRLLQKLSATGYVYRNEVTKRVCAGPQALYPKSLHHPLNRLRQEAREQLRALRERYDESVCLIVFVGHERVIIDAIQGREPLSPLYETRLRNPLHASAAGIILLNELPSKERRRLLGEEPFKAPTVHTVTSYAVLEKQFEALQRHGYAVARETTFIGVNAVAAPIRSEQKAIGCIAITGSTQTITEARLGSFGEVLRHSADLISWGAPSVKAVAHFLGV